MVYNKNVFPFISKFLDTLAKLFLL